MSTRLREVEDICDMVEDLGHTVELLQDQKNAWRAAAIGLSDLEVEKVPTLKQRLAVAELFKIAKDLEI